MIHSVSAVLAQAPIIEPRGIKSRDCIHPRFMLLLSDNPRYFFCLQCSDLVSVATPRLGFEHTVELIAWKNKYFSAHRVR
jgi:hypothetical protein